MKLFAKAILWVEPLLLAVVVAAFWFDNSTRINFLALLIPPIIARLILYRRLWISTPLNVLLYLFLLLCAVNTYVALRDPLAPPYSWGWYEIGRPIMGVALALSMTSIAYERGRIDGILMAAVLVALLVGVLGLGGAQYIDKSAQLDFFIRFIPQIRDFPGAQGGFNVNEIGGAMAFFAPLAAGIAFYDWRHHQQAPLRGTIATVAFGALALALFLGQSRLAIIGVVVTIGAVVFAVIPHGRWRYGALALLALFCAAEVGLVTGVFDSIGSTAGTQAAPGLSQRDESSLSQRPVIWGAALGIIRDDPLTGVGLNEFRSPIVREKYPVPNFAMTVVPHAHDELLQIGTDLGIPGMLIYAAWHIALAVMVWRTWRKGDAFLRAVSVSAAAGLVAHAIFGLADAITLFDRFTFAYWLLVGLVGGAYVLAWRGQPARALAANLPARTESSAIY